MIFIDKCYILQTKFISMIYSLNNANHNIVSPQWLINYAFLAAEKAGLKRDQYASFTEIGNGYISIDGVNHTIVFETDTTITRHS